MLLKIRLLKAIIKPRKKKNCGTDHMWTKTTGHDFLNTAWTSFTLFMWFAELGLLEAIMTLLGY